jgi:hypothetical protein
MRQKKQGVGRRHLVRGHVGEANNTENASRRVCGVDPHETKTRRGRRHLVWACGKRDCRANGRHREEVCAWIHGAKGRCWEAMLRTSAPYYFLSKWGSRPLDTFCVLDGSNGGQEQWCRRAILLLRMTIIRRSVHSEQGQCPSDGQTHVKLRRPNGSASKLARLVPKVRPNTCRPSMRKTEQPCLGSLPPGVKTHAKLTNYMYVHILLLSC